MYSKFAVALLASLVAAKGDNNGNGRDNAVSNTLSRTGDTVYVHLYNARVRNDDGTYTYELHGDFGIDVVDVERRFMYGFCLRPNTPDEGSTVVNTDWDCMTVKVDLNTGANLTTRFVQDAWAAGDSPDGYVSNAQFLTAWIDEPNDWVMLEAKNEPCTEDVAAVDPAEPITCTGFNTHFKRNFQTGDDKDWQYTTDMAGDEYQLSVFVQEYDSTSLWDDSNVDDSTTRNDMYFPTIVTPVMQGFIDLAEGADDALTDIQDAERDALDASAAIEGIEDTIEQELPNFDTAKAASEAATTLEAAQAALTTLSNFKTDIDQIRVNLQAELAKIADAQAIADDDVLEAAAAFEVPISVPFGQAKNSITAISDEHTEDLADLDARIADVAAAVTAGEAKVASLTPAPEPETDGDDDDNTPDGDADTDGDADGDDGATSLTTFATVVVASVYALAF